VYAEKSSSKWNKRHRKSLPKACMSTLQELRYLLENVHGTDLCTGYVCYSQDSVTPGTVGLDPSFLNVCLSISVA
jgi:hypothetical protein